MTTQAILKLVTCISLLGACAGSCTGKGSECPAGEHDETTLLQTKRTTKLGTDRLQAKELSDFDFKNPDTLPTDPLAIAELCQNLTTTYEKACGEVDFAQGVLKQREQD
jgi:hypothetical protein